MLCCSYMVCAGLEDEPEDQAGAAQSCAWREGHTKRLLSLGVEMIK